MLGSNGFHAGDTPFQMPTERIELSTTKLKVWRSTVELSGQKRRREVSILRPFDYETKTLPLRHDAL